MKTLFHRFIFPALVVTHFSLLLTFSLINSIQSHLDLYCQEASYYQDAINSIHRIQKFMAPFATWQILTGTRTGYGFYAPQVSSHIEPFFDFYRGDKMVTPYFRLTFSTHEAGLRFQTVFDQHLEKLDEALGGKELETINDNLYYRSLDLRVHSLSTSVLNLLPAIGADRVQAGLFLYDVPPLYAVSKLDQPFHPAFLKTFNYDYRLHSR